MVFANVIGYWSKTWSSASVWPNSYAFDALAARLNGEITGSGLWPWSQRRTIRARVGQFKALIFERSVGEWGGTTRYDFHLYASLPIKRVEIYKIVDESNHKTRRYKLRGLSSDLTRLVKTVGLEKQLRPLFGSQTRKVVLSAEKIQVTLEGRAFSVHDLENTISKMQVLLSFLGSNYRGAENKDMAQTSVAGSANQLAEPIGSYRNFVSLDAAKFTLESVICPYCRSDLEPEAQSLIECLECRSLIHKLCLKELGHCPVFACHSRRFSAI